MVRAAARATRALDRRTELDTVHPRTDKIPPSHQSRAFGFALLFLIYLTLPLLSTHPALAEEKDLVLGESGIHYPGGYDRNTVDEVQGKAYGYSQPESGPGRFQLASGKESYTILTSPRWYWNDLGGKVSDGAEVRVRGSKTLGKDGNLYIIAQEMRVLPSGQSLVFRNEDGYPLWKDSGMGPAGTRGGMTSSPAGRSGMGSSGMGRGRR